MALKVSPSPKLLQNALLDQLESVWFGDLLMEHRVLNRRRHPAIDRRLLWDL